MIWIETGKTNTHRNSVGFGCVNPSIYLCHFSGEIPSNLFLIRDPRGGDNDDKFISAQPGNYSVSWEKFCQGFGCSLNRKIPFFMPIMVINLFQPVHIGKENIVGAPCNFRLLKKVFSSKKQPSAVIKTGQIILD